MQPPQIVRLPSDRHAEASINTLFEELYRKLYFSRKTRERWETFTNVNDKVNYIAEVLGLGGPTAIEEIAEEAPIYDDIIVKDTQLTVRPNGGTGYYSTIVEALDSIARKRIDSKNLLTIKVQNGTYNNHPQINVWHPDANLINFKGNITNHANVILNMAINAQGFYVCHGTGVRYLTGFTIIGNCPTYLHQAGLNAYNCSSIRCTNENPGDSDYAPAGLTIKGFYFGILAAHSSHITAFGSATKYVDCSYNMYAGIWAALTSSINFEYGRANNMSGTPYGFGMVAWGNSYIQASYGLATGNKTNTPPGFGIDYFAIYSSHIFQTNPPGVTTASGYWANWGATITAQHRTGNNYSPASGVVGNNNSYIGTV